MIKVMVFGTFDILHQGHIDFFRQAREHGDFLIAVTARDSTVKQIGKEVIQNENERLKNVKQFADLAVLGSSGDKYEVIRRYNPDIICLGYDQTHFVDGLQNLNIEILRLKPYQENKFKSSLIRNSMKS